MIRKSLAAIVLLTISIPLQSIQALAYESKISSTAEIFSAGSNSIVSTSIYDGSYKDKDVTT
jgi:hypothetical protein